MTGAQVASGDDNTKSPSTLFTSNKAINFSDRNTVPSESDLMLNSSQALMNEGFKKKAILEWEISPIRLPPSPKNQQCEAINNKLIIQHRCDTQEDLDRNAAQKNKYTQSPLQGQCAGEVIKTEQNQENILRGQNNNKRNSLQMQNKILSNILKKSTSHHISELNKQLRTSAGGSILAMQLKQQQQTTIQTTEATDQFVSQQFLRQRTNTQDMFYFKNTCTQTNTTAATQQQQETQEQTIFTENNKIHYVPPQHLIQSTNDHQLLLIRDSIESIPSNTTRIKQGHRSSNSFYNLLCKIQSNVEQNFQTKKEQNRSSIKPTLTTKQIISDRHFIQSTKNQIQQKQETIFSPQTCKTTTNRGQYQLADQQQHKFFQSTKYDNLNQKKNIFNIPIQELTQKQLQKNAQYFFPCESDNDSTPFAIPKNQFQYHYRDNSYQLIQNNQMNNPNQIASTTSQESTKNTDSERSLGRQRSNAYSSLAGNLDDIYKKLQNMKVIQNIQPN